MNPSLDSTHTCICGRSFLRPGAFNYHQRTCSRTKKRLSGALEKAKEVLRSRKRQRREASDQLELERQRTAASVSESAVSEPTVRPATDAFPEPIAIPDNSNLPISERRIHRDIRLPMRFRDEVPVPLPPNPPQDSPPSDPQSSNEPAPSPPFISSRILQIIRSPRNVFGLFRQYLRDNLPSHDPEEHITLPDLFDDPSSIVAPPASLGLSASLPTTALADGMPFHPYPNRNSFLLGEWYWNGSAQKSQENFRDLLGIIGSPDFHPEDVQHTKWATINDDLARNNFHTVHGTDEGEGAEWMDEDAGWRKAPIKISVPFHSRNKHPGPKDYIVGELHHRSLIAVMHEKLANPEDSRFFHYEPFELYWKPTQTSARVRVHGELYTSPAFLDAQRDLENSPGEPCCDLPRVVMSMMFWSDVTHLTSFGSAKLWPCYLSFGNESKYRRCKPTSNLTNHVAYFESLRDSFKDFANQHTGKKGPSKAFMTHCRREVLHAQWKILLDDEFLQAHEHGVVIKCCDGIIRRFYPRIFTYSADYPEKVLLVGLRPKGSCPCPRCLIPRSSFQALGSAQDIRQRKVLARIDDEDRRRRIAIAREIIYDKKYCVNSKSVEYFLKEQSLTPTSNAFSERLHPFSFNMFLMLLVDLMHEFELGVWKALFIHLLRMLRAYDPNLVHELDRRFRQVPTFGRNTIRRFSSNVSEMKKMAARDFEDLLQCAIPVFDGLFPEPHNTAVLQLLFICAHWHGMAKLHMHIDPTLDILDNTTIQISDAFRTFNNETCPAFDTRELPREVNARKRRKAAKAKATSKSAQPALSTSSDLEDDEPSGPLHKGMNLQTYKYHTLGDYASTIRQYGTTDSYSTECGELAHRKAKSYYKRTDRKDFVRQLAQIERRVARIRRIRTRLAARNLLSKEPVPITPQEHHHIGASQNNSQHIGSFLRNHEGDPATKNFLPKLKKHILPRVLSKLRNSKGPNPQDDNANLPDVDGGDPNSIYFKNDRIFQHSLIRINYTTYDVRRSQDVVNTSTSQCNILVIAEPEDDHPDTESCRFRYARVLGVYHANVIYIGPGMLDYEPHRVEFLWVRWYESVDTTRTGWDARRLDRVRFPSVNDDNSFGFIDPLDVLRACHIIPAFAKKLLHVDGKGLSHCARDSSDWAGYFINRFVDRDMVMRYHYGLAVGHTYAHASAERRLNDHLHHRDITPELQGDEDVVEEPSVAPERLRTDTFIYSEYSGESSPEESSSANSMDCALDSESSEVEDEGQARDSSDEIVSDDDEEFLLLDG